MSKFAKEVRKDQMSDFMKQMAGADTTLNAIASAQGAMKNSLEKAELKREKRRLKKATKKAKFGPITHAQHQRNEVKAAKRQQRASTNNAMNKLMGNAFAYEMSVRKPWEATGAMIPDESPEPLATGTTTEEFVMLPVGTEYLYIFTPNYAAGVYGLTAGTPSVPVTYSVSNYGDYAKILSEAQNYAITGFGINFIATGALGTTAGQCTAAILDSALVMDRTNGIPSLVAGVVRGALLESPNKVSVPVTDLCKGFRCWVPVLKSEELEIAGAAGQYNMQGNRETSRPPATPFGSATLDQMFLRDFVVVVMIEGAQAAAGIKAQVYMNNQFTPVVADGASSSLRTCVSSKHCVALVTEAMGQEGKTELRDCWAAVGTGGKLSTDTKGWWADRWADLKDALPGVLGNIGRYAFNEFKGKIPVLGSILANQKHAIAKAMGVPELSPISRRPFLPKYGKFAPEAECSMTLTEFTAACAEYIEHKKVKTARTVAIVQPVDYEEVDEKGQPVGEMKRGVQTVGYVSSDSIQPMYPLDSKETAEEFLSAKKQREIPPNVRALKSLEGQQFLKEVALINMAGRVQDIESKFEAVKADAIKSFPERTKKFLEELEDLKKSMGKEKLFAEEKPMEVETFDQKSDVSQDPQEAFEAAFLESLVRQVQRDPEYKNWGERDAGWAEWNQKHYKFLCTKRVKQLLLENGYVYHNFIFKDQEWLYVYTKPTQFEFGVAGVPGQFNPNTNNPVHFRHMNDGVAVTRS